jgi:hypothetical protein
LLETSSTQVPWSTRYVLACKVPLYRFCGTNSFVVKNSVEHIRTSREVEGNKFFYNEKPWVYETKHIS